MKPTSLSQLTNRLGGQLTGSGEALAYGWALDHRDVNLGDVFVAIKGARQDGHQFVNDALSAGAAAAVVEADISCAGPLIRVPNVVNALAKMALSYRETFEGPVIAVTGSAGKTTTKEFIAAALRALGPVLKPEGNRNTEYSAPLLWAELNPDFRSVVVEMGMRGFGQIAHLASFSKPTIGLVTNIGYSHIEMVGSRMGISRAKGELLTALPSTGVALLWDADEYLGFLSQLTTATVHTFGFGSDAAARITSYEPQGWQMATLRGTVFGSEFVAEIPAVGRHLATNAIGALLAAVIAGSPLSDAADALQSAVLPPMRMETVTFNGATILLDTYNASPPSVIAAIETINEAHNSGGRRLAVLGEMRELGPESEAAHRLVGASKALAAFDEVVLLGADTQYIEAGLLEGGFPRSKIFHASGLEEIRDYLTRLEPSDTVLIKGSRALELERALPS